MCFTWLVDVLINYHLLLSQFVFFFFKQKTAYEMRISDWSSDVCSSDLVSIDALATLDVRLAETEKLIAEARLQGQGADGRLDPSVGLGMRQLDRKSVV